MSRISIPNNINELSDDFLKAMQELKAAISNGSEREEINEKRSVLAELTLAMNRCPNIGASARHSPNKIAGSNDLTANNYI